MLSFYFPPLAHPLSKFWHSTCRKLEDHEFVGHSTHRFKHLLLLLWVAFLIKSCFYSTQIMILFTNFLNRSNLIVVISIPISIADSHSSYSDYNLGFNLHDKHLKFFHHFSSLLLLLFSIFLALLAVPILFSAF